MLIFNSNLFSNKKITTEQHFYENILFIVSNIASSIISSTTCRGIIDDNIHVYISTCKPLPSATCTSAALLHVFHYLH